MHPIRSSRARRPFRVGASTAFLLASPWLVASCSAPQEGRALSSAATGGVRFVGRVDTSDSAAVRFAWSGSGFLARFSGDSLAVRLGGGQQYSVLVDGKLRPKLVPSGEFDTLAQDLGPGEHVVEVYRRTEAHLGESVFLGLRPGSGKLLPPPPPPQRRIEIIGDSISCGYGNEGPDMNCGFTPDTENHYLSYGALAARELGAELVTIAWSGKGVVCNYGDGPESCRDPLPHYYDRTLPERPDSRWDFSSWQPDAVVINLGTNDFSTEQDPTQAQFEAAYLGLLERVRAAYADALILCTLGPMLTGSDLATAKSYIENAIGARTRAGDVRVKSFEIAVTHPDNGYGCDWHPSLRTHQVMAQELGAVLRAELGW